MSTIAGIAAIGWASFTALEIAIGQWHVAVFKAVAALLCFAVRLSTRRVALSWERSVSIVALASLIALALSSAYTGGIVAPAAPYIGLVTLIAAIVEKPYERRLWLALTLAVMAALSIFVPIDPNARVSTIELVVLPFSVALCTYFIAVAWRLAADGQAATLEQRESTINQQAIELRAALAAAKAESDKKTELVGVASHEIRGPLQGLLGGCQNLEETELSEAQRQVLQTIRTSGESIADLLNDLLDFARIDAGRLDVVDAPAPLAALLEDAVDAFAPLAAAKRLAIHSIVPATLPEHVVLDAGRIAQVLRNLIGNAVKFTETGHVVVSAHREGADLLISVNDTGPGIPEKAIARIFEPFEQVSDRLSDRRLGTGLGLWISRAIVDASGAKLTVVSTPASGSRFEVRFPERLAKAEQPTPPAATLSAEVHTKSGLAQEAYETTGARVGVRVVRPGAGSELDFSFLDLDTLSDDALANVTIRGRAVVVAGSASELPRMERWADRLRARVILHPLRASRFVGALTAPAAAKSPVDREKLSGRLLIVDDDAIGRRLAARLAQRLGLDVAEAESGAAGTAAAEASAFDVVLVDLNLPDMKGVEVAETIRRASMWPPVLLGWTGSTRPEDRDAMRRAGIAAVMTKPVALAEMTAQLRRALEARQPERRSVQLPVCNPERIRELRQSLRSVDVFRELTHDFLQQIEPRVSMVLSHVAGGALERVEFEAHAFSSVAGTFGATLLQVRLQTLERAARDGLRDELGKLADGLENVATETHRTLAAELDRIAQA